MIRLFSKLLNIRPTEWPRLLILYVMLFLFVTGLVWGSIILEAVFLKQVGLTDLPLFFIVKALISIPVVALYTGFAGRIANDKLLISILLVAGAVIVIGLILLSLGLSTATYWLLFLLIFPLDDVVSVHWYTYVNGFYNTQSAKRIVPVLVTAIGIANIVAGLTVPVLNRLLFSSILIMWLSTLLAMALLAWLMPYLLKEGKMAGEQAGYSSDTYIGGGKSALSYFDSLREGYRYVLQSDYLRWLALSALLLMTLFALLQYQTSEILLKLFKTEVGISDFTSLLTWVANLALLPVQLFLLNRIIGQIGVGNAEMIFPVGTLLISGGLTVLPGQVTAGLAYLDRTKLHASIGYPIDSLLFNAVPLRMKARARAFIGGLVVPFGAGIGGILILLLRFIPVAWLIAALIMLLAIAYVGSAWIIRKQYRKALITMLEQEDFSFLLSPDASNLTITDPATLAGLRQKLEASTSYEFTIFMAKLISQIGGKEATSILSQAARTATEARSRAAILDVLVAADTRDDIVRQLYTDFLNDPDGRVRQSAIMGLEQLTGAEDKDFLELASKMLSDPDTEVRAIVLPNLLQASDRTYQAAATQALAEFLNDQDAHQRARGVHILNQSGDPRFIPQLVEHLSDPADEVRLEAALALETFPLSKIPPTAVNSVLEKMSQLMRDPVERIRQAGLIILGRIGSREIYQLLINALTDPSPQVRITAVDALIHVGKAVIPVVHSALNSPDPLLRKMATVTLSRINQREFSPLVETHITGNLLSIYRGYGLLAALAPCAKFPTISVLQSALHDQNQQFLDEIFYLLTAVHETEAVKIIAESFESEAPHVRANAAEALESLTSPQTARLVAPLFEPEMSPAQLVQISQDTWDMAPPGTTEAVKQFLTNPDDPWLRAMMTLALGEMGASFLPPQTALPQSATLKVHEIVDQRLGELNDTGSGNTSSTPEVLSSSDKADVSQLRPSQPANLLDNLIEPSNAPPAAPEPKPEERPARRLRPADLFSALSEPSSTDSVQPPKPEETKARRVRPGNLLDALISGAESVLPQSHENVRVSQSSPAASLPFSLAQIEAMVEAAFSDPYFDVRLAARAAKRIMAGSYITSVLQEEGLLLSAIEKIIFLKEVPFFQGMTIDQLKVLANVCEEELFEEDVRIFNEGDPGGALYVVVSGRVGIEQERRKGSFARLATIEAHSYFGEMNLFDNSPRSATAIALQDTLILRLRREPLIALARQYPDLSLELINVLSQRLRESNDRVAELTRTKPRELHKLYDKFD